RVSVAHLVGRGARGVVEMEDRGDPSLWVLATRLDRAGEGGDLSVDVLPSPLELGRVLERQHDRHIAPVRIGTSSLSGELRSVLDRYAERLHGGVADCDHQLRRAGRELVESSPGPHVLAI